MHSTVDTVLAYLNCHTYIVFVVIFTLLVDSSLLAIYFVCILRLVGFCSQAACYCASLLEEMGDFSGIVGMGLSKPHISDMHGMSVVFTNIYVEIWINGMNVMHSQKHVKNQVKN